MDTSIQEILNQFPPLQWLIGAVIFLAGPIIVWRIGIWIARPLDLAAKNRRHATQFTIVDFFCLFVLIQVPTALICSIEMGPGVRRNILFVLGGYFWFAIAMVWWKCAQIMSRAGINTPRHRVILLLVVLPVVLVGPLTPFVFTIVVAIGMAKFATAGGLVMTSVAMAIAIPAAMVLCAHLVRRIVAASEAVAEVPVELVDESP